MTKRIIYLDLDGVFADYHSFVSTILTRDEAADPVVRWRALENIPHVFSKFKPIPGSQDFFRAIEAIAVRFDYDVKILTAAPQPTGMLNTAELDKQIWVADFIDPVVEVIVSDGWQDKKNYYNPGDILIDDTNRNCIDWPGTSIYHYSFLKTIAQLITVLGSR